MSKRFVNMERNGVWPHPDQRGEYGDPLAWVLRHTDNELRREDRQLLASVIEAYVRLTGMTQRDLIAWQREFRAAMRQAGRKK